MYLRTAPTSDQHRLLLAHSRAGNNVYYAAPAFHTLEELNRLAADQAVWQQSRLFRPEFIGRLDEEFEHFIAYHREIEDWWIFSDPKKGEADTSPEAFEHYMRTQVAAAPVVEDFQVYIRQLRNSIWESIEGALDFHPDGRLAETWLDQVQVSIERYPVEWQPGLIALYVLNSHLMLVGRSEQ